MMRMLPWRHQPSVEFACAGTWVRIRITGFVPTDPKDLAGHRAILDAIDLATKSPAATEGSTTDALFRLLEIEQFDVKPVTRRAKDEGGGS